ncbi:hypothetical protein EKH79_12275 [Dyella dinghuensis]|uniref:Uncharacterized protein n=1 Tax=Dyella dinghuensis TaxID=1920169 RepID=A0A3S0PXR8_9GAMM|nr:hypothetical protein [Dyella dinghuensis]RUL63180.1 hypothetical protein EKH79_12275 [Dyella dinghuensis]
MNSLLLLFATMLTTTNGFAAQTVASSPKSSPPKLPKSCLGDMWQGLLPLIAKGSYVTVPDVEKLANIKMQHVVDVAPGDTIATYEGNATTPLSIRVEVLEVPTSYGAGHITYSWQVLQGRSVDWHGSTSVVDFSCVDSSGGLQLSKVEADLSSLGFHQIGSTAQEVHAEYFAGRLSTIAIYFDLPVESVPTVSSIHIVGLRNESAKSSSVH